MLLWFESYVECFYVLTYVSNVVMFILFSEVVCRMLCFDSYVECCYVLTRVPNVVVLTRTSNVVMSRLVSRMF